jgi:IclR family acetate operon transcriptional repressor
METADVDFNSTGMTLVGEQIIPEPLAGNTSSIPTGIRSVAKALCILEAIARSGGEMTLTAIADATALNISTCHHLLATLQDSGFVARLRGKRTYVLGAKILFLHTAALKQVNLPRRAQRVLEYLNMRTREAVQIAVMQGDTLVTLLRKGARQPSIADPQVPDTDDAAHATATGKAILAWLPESELTRIIDRRGLRRFTPNTITEISALIEELRLVRRHGYAMDRAESQPGMISVATAIRDDAGTVVGAIGIACPIARANEATVAYLREQVMWGAASLTADLRDEAAEPTQPPVVLFETPKPGDADVQPSQREDRAGFSHPGDDESLDPE